MDIQELISYLTAAITIASVVTAVTPTPKDDKVLGKVYKVIEALGLVVGKAKQK